jgi:uncharacterized protein (DUF2141 family)
MLKPPARQAFQHLLYASALSMFGVASIANAQVEPVLASHSPQTVAQSQEPNPTEPVVDDRFKPRVYGGATEPPAPVPAPVVEPETTEQQANVILNETDNTEIPADTGPFSQWPASIRDQFVDVIAGVPILKDPENCADGNPALRIKVENVKKTEGIIVADLHDDVKENFLVWDKVVLRVRATAQKGESFFCMPVPTAGDYSVAIYHDKNGNKEFDKNFLGLPKERFGMSNNPKFGTKSPKYEEATFAVPEEGADITIKLRRTSDILSGNQD